MAASNPQNSPETDMNAGDQQFALNKSQSARDVCDYLEERSELIVEIEDTRAGPKPVARTPDGGKASVADFPSGKNSGGGNMSEKTFVRMRDTLIDFVAETELESLRNLTPRHISNYGRLMRQRNYARATKNIKWTSLKTFLEWAESEMRSPTEPQRLSETVENKRNALGISQREMSRAKDPDHKISDERAEDILGYLAKYDYASRDMVEYLLTLHIGLRKSGLLSINTGDIDFARNMIQIRHRPEKTGVRLKRGKDGERDVIISPEVAGVLRDYLSDNRSEPADGSKALITSSYGRLDGSNVTRDIYFQTACENCREERTKQTAHKCDKSIAPHDLRRVAITRMRNRGMLWETISQRVNASVDTLKMHYDSSTHSESAERRREEIMRTL